VAPALKASKFSRKRAALTLTLALAQQPGPQSPEHAAMDRFTTARNAAESVAQRGTGTSSSTAPGEPPLSPQARPNLALLAEQLVEEPPPSPPASQSQQPPPAQGGTASSPNKGRPPKAAAAAGVILPEVPDAVQAVPDREPRLARGRWVVLRGLGGRADLNGESGRVVGWLDGKERYPNAMLTPFHAVVTPF